jgi:divalent anion:Na+ symporter, DASS family
MAGDDRPNTMSRPWIRWLLVLGSGFAVAATPVPTGVEPSAWRLFAVFVATMVGLIAQPLPGGAMVFLGVCTLCVTGIVPIAKALAGYSDSVVWLVLAAFFISRGMIKTGLGRRIALQFVRLIGKTSLGLAYSLALSDGVLAMIIPSNGARSGGIIFPISKSLAETYDSRPGETAGKLGSFLMVLLYNTDVVVCAMFLTGQASNALIAGFAKSTTGIDLTYRAWLMAGLLPGLVSLLVVPLLFYRLYPPAIKHTPAATELAQTELSAMGPLSSAEKLMLAVFALVLTLWLTMAWHRIDYAAVALLGVAVLLITRVLDWNDLLSERGAWDVFFWYGGLVQLARLLGESGVTRWFAQITAGWIAGWEWWAALGAILLVYFYAHYGFASITAHATAMFVPFLTVTVAAGTPPYLAVLLLAFFSNLCATLTHYGTTPGPIYFGAGYVPQGTWWRMGLIASFVNIPIWIAIGFVWWKVLGLF